MSIPSKIDQLHRYLHKNGFSFDNTNNTCMSDNQYASMILRAIKTAKPIKGSIDDHFREKCRVYKVLTAITGKGKIKKSLRMLIGEGCKK